MTTVVPAFVPPPVQGPVLPRHGEPGWTVWPRRIWPIDPLAAAPRRLLVAAMVASAVGTAIWRPTVLSIGYGVVGVLVFAVVYAGRRPRAVDWVGMVLTLGLLAVPGLLDAGWLGALCMIAAWVLGWTTIIGGATWTAVFLGPFIPWFAPARVAGWAQRGAPRPRAVPHLGRAAAVVGVTVALLVVFGALFAAADPAFEHLFTGLVPKLSVGDIISRAVVFAMVLAFALCGGYLVRFGIRLDALAPPQGKPVARWEWALPLGVLDALFVTFVAVQASVLFGGHRHVLDTEGLTYAEYARQGFWQLLGVSALTLVVLSIAVRKARRTTSGDRMAIRILIGILCATSIVIVVSAIHRMWLYQEAYGFSVLRLLVITVELWLGAVFLMIAACGVRMSARWLPRAVLVAGVVALLGLAAVNPERLVADRNIDRYLESGTLDTEYLYNLSADADPALVRLPVDLRPCQWYRSDEPDPWYEFNLSRWQASRDSLTLLECSG